METMRLITKILDIFEKNMGSDSDIINEMSLKGSEISKRRFIRTLEMMIDGELINGVNVNVKNNMVYFSDPRITLKGLEYLFQKDFISKNPYINFKEEFKNNIENFFNELLEDMKKLRKMTEV